MNSYRIDQLILIENVVAEWEPALAERVYAVVAGESTGHDIYHFLRVKALALQIAEEESLDRDVLVATAYLHDIGRGREFEGHGDHVLYGMSQAAALLPQVGFPRAKVEAVGLCIEYHEEYAWARSVKDLPPERAATAVRGEILGFQDADRLDAIGAVGLARMFMFGGAYRQPLWHPHVRPGHWEHGDLGSSSYNHLHEKLLKLKDTMNTATGRRLAKGRHRFMVQFAAQFELEWGGKA
jgi:uncharacterized protein